MIIQTRRNKFEQRAYNRNGQRGPDSRDNYICYNIYF